MYRNKSESQPIQAAESVEGACWPDPDPAPSNVNKGGACSAVRPLVDDVTRMNRCEVERIFHPRTKEDVKWVLALAASTGHKVSMRGTKHCEL